MSTYYRDQLAARDLGYGPVRHQHPALRELEERRAAHLDAHTAVRDAHGVDCPDETLYATGGRVLCAAVGGTPDE